jgi:hypothetical protein
LHPIRRRAAEDGDVVVAAEFQLRVQRQSQREKQGDEVSGHDDGKGG